MIALGSAANKQFPIELEVLPIGESSGAKLKNFMSYSFDKNILTPASAFRFTAGDTDFNVISSIRSGDTVGLWVRNKSGEKNQIATGFVDETDCHTSGEVEEFAVTGRDTISQLVDNSAIDSKNKIIMLSKITLKNAALELIKNTRMVQNIIDRSIPTGELLFRTNPGETKISALQRYLEYCNCLIWADVDGTAIIGKPRMHQASMGNLICKKSDPKLNNVLDIRSRRNLTNAIRKIAVQLQTLSITDPTLSTVENKGEEILEKSNYLIGKSIYRTFTLGNGEDAVNQIYQLGSNPTSNVITNIGQALAAREIAHSNMEILDVTCVVKGHINENGVPYDVDQVYTINYEKDDIDDDMYVYAVKYDLTEEHGMLTTLRLCKLYTIVADVRTT